MLICKLGQVSFGMFKLVRLGEMIFGTCWVRLGEVSFRTLKLYELGKMSFGILKLGGLGYMLKLDELDEGEL